MTRTLATVAWVVPCLVLVACGDTSSTQTVLSRVTPATGCTSGGYTIASGIDKNGDGVLQDDEVAQSSDVCSGTTTTGMPGSSGYPTLTSTTDVPDGDRNCFHGGVKIEQGVDDGTGGGTAGDGMLQPGEVKSTKYVCDGGGDPVYPGSTTPPTEPAGAAIIDTSGGNGTTGSGGNAGYVQAELSDGSLGGHVKIWKTGAADATFTVPTVSFNGGAVVFTVTADTALSTYASTAAGLATADEYFLVNSDTTLYKDVAGVATPVTGIDIQAGKTLTFALNWGSYAYVSFTHDVRNAGKVKTVMQGDNASQLTLYCHTFLGATGSSIELVGNAAVAVGGNGGYLDLEVTAHLINQGTINTSGGNGNAGGAGQTIYLYAENGALYNTGALTASGGVGAMTTGGNGSDVYLYGGYEGTFNSGAITANGGNGVTAGGNGGYIEISDNSLGSVISSGAITHKGGTCSDTNCNGGWGGSFQSYTYNGKTVFTGGMDASGADGKGTGLGGSGGDAYFYNYDYNTSPAGNVSTTPSGSMSFSGTINLRGGSGATGGGGGYLYVELDPYYYPRGQEIIFYGYTDVKAKGGDTTDGTGGYGGGFYLYNDASWPQGQYAGPGGGVINYANYDGRGGSGRYGRYGSEVYFQTNEDYYFGSWWEIVENHGVIDVRGGSSAADSATGGGGGYVYFAGIAGIRNAGVIKVDGASASGANASGGSGGTSYFNSDYGPCNNTAAINASGGAATGGGSYGGSGGEVYVYGTPASNTAACTLSGGAGVLQGGDGGYAELFSSGNFTSMSSGSYALAGGAGTTGGSMGELFIDGSDMTP